MLRENGNDMYHYVYSDHLRSILTVTEASGNVEVEQNFDAWGRRRNPTDWSYVGVPARPDWLYRGYTGHEHLDPFVLINMNGRLYDPVVGRVLSPDNFVQDPFSTQGFNRYSYGYNNPLRYTDPDGNFAFVPFLIAAGIGAISGYLSGKAHGAEGWELAAYTLGGAAIGGLSAGIGEAVLGAFSASAQSGMFASSILAYGASGAAAGFVSGGGFSLLNGGNFWEGALKGGAIGGLTGALAGVLKYELFYPNNLLAEGPPTLRGGWLNGVTVKAPRLIVAGSNNSDSWLSNVGTVAGLTANYFFGFGPENRTYVNTSEANAFRNSYITNQARNYWYNEVNAGHKTIFDGVTNYRGIRQFGGGNFGLKGAVQAGIDPMEQYVGGFRVDIASDGQNLTFTINNTTSFKSFSYRLLGSWRRSTFPIMGDIRQTYTFTESIKFRVR